MPVGHDADVVGGGAVDNGPLARRVGAIMIACLIGPVHFLRGVFLPPGCTAPLPGPPGGGAGAALFVNNFVDNFAKSLIYQGFHRESFFFAHTCAQLVITVIYKHFFFIFSKKPKNGPAGHRPRRAAPLPVDKVPRPAGRAVWGAVKSRRQ